MPYIALYPRFAPDVLAIAERLVPPGFTYAVTDPAAGTAALSAGLKSADFLVGFVGQLPPAAWAAADNLKLIQLLSAGYDKIEIEVARGHGVPVALNGGANAIGVAEHAVMLMLAVFKRLTTLAWDVRAGVWRAATAGETLYHELGGKRVGLVGMGQIGREVAKRLRGFDVDIVYTDVRRLAPAEEASLGVRHVDLATLLAESQVVSLHVPLLPETREIIDHAALARMRPDAILINTARGELVDEGALVAALSAGRLAGAGLDVLTQEPPAADNPLLTMDRVIVTPHTAGPTWESWPRRFANAFANVSRVANGERPLWVIPELRDLLADGAPVRRA